jgi:hypothetical protein
VDDPYDLNRFAHVPLQVSFGIVRTTDMFVHPVSSLNLKEGARETGFLL